MLSDGSPVQLGRYVLYDAIASGGMGAVHLGRLQGAVGFSRIVAVKRLHPILAKEPEFAHMFLDEARLAGRLRHPNIVSTLDVLEAEGEVLIVMEYVHGVSLAQLAGPARARGERAAPGLAVAVVSQALYGLHAAHEATGDDGQSLRLVHRDVSPQNVLVGADGVTRLMDFGVARAAGRLQLTGDGKLKGKLSYMAPEQLQHGVVDRRADLFAAGVVLWETLTGQRLFQYDGQGQVVQAILFGEIPAPSRVVPGLPPAFDAVVARALAREPADRFSTAREMCAALLSAHPPAAQHEVGEWVEASVHEELEARVALVERFEARGVGLTPAGEGALAAVRTAAASTEDQTTPDRTPGSQVTRASSVEGSERGQPVRRRSAWLLGLGGVLVGSTAAAVLVVPAWTRATPAVSTASAAAMASPAGPSSHEEPPSSASVAASTAASSDPSASSSAGVDEHPPTMAPSRPRQAAAVPPTHGADCNPPYRRGPDGHKVWKRECF